MIFAIGTQLHAVSNESNFRSLFEAELHYVWHTLRRLGVPERDRIDVSHEVFLAVHRHLPKYDHARPLRPWLFGFAFRCASDYRRRAHHRYEVIGVESGDARDDKACHGEISANRDLLERALLHIDDDKCAVLILHDLEERPMSEISEVLSIPIPTGYSRLRAAREGLAAAIRKLQGGEQ